MNSLLESRQPSSYMMSFKSFRVEKAKRTETSVAEASVTGSIEVTDENKIKIKTRSENNSSASSGSNSTQREGCHRVTMIGHNGGYLLVQSYESQYGLRDSFYRKASRELSADEAAQFWVEWASPTLKAAVYNKWTCTNEYDDDELLVHLKLTLLHQPLQV